MPTIKYLYLIFSLISSSIVAQKITNKSLKNLIESNPSLSSSFVGVSVFDLSSHDKVLSYNADKNFIPASVLKILYTLAAIDIKGKEFKFKTKVSYTGNILYDGTLEGDLIISPTGDPTLGSPRFYKEGINTLLIGIKEALLTSDITCIDGDIILEMPMQSYPVHGSWTTEDIGNYYAGGARAVNINDNLYKIKFKLGNSKGEDTKILNISPVIPYLNIVNHVKTDNRGTGDNSYIYGLPYTFTREIKGTLPLGNKTYTIKGSIPNPPLTFMRLLTDYLDKNNFYFSNFKILNNQISDKTFLFSMDSPKLIDIVKECNNWSINLYSEALAKLLCLQSNHPNDYLYEYEIASLFSKYKIGSTKTQIVDGCGLSTENHISPNTITSFIDKMVGILGISTVIDILPKAKVEGYAKNIKIQDLWIKSGSIQGVLNYSGIYKAKNGKYFAFAIMTNNNNDKLKKKIKNRLLILLKTIINQSTG